MVPSLTPYNLPFPKMGVPHAHRPTIREWPYLLVIRYTSCLILISRQNCKQCWGKIAPAIWIDDGRVFRVGGSNGAISGYIKCKMAASRHLGKFRMAVSAQGVIRYTGSRVGFSGSADRMALFSVTSNPSRMAISPQRLIRSTYIARIA